MSAPVSVIIPTYNRASDLRRALASLQAQTHQAWEAVVVDNHSQDGTRETVEALGDSRIRFLLIHNQGVVARSRNLGIESATHAYVAFLDSDDWWSPTKLEKSVARLEAGADLVYHDLYIVRSARQRFFWKRARTRPLSAPVFDDLLASANALATSSVVTRRKLLLEVGGFTEDPTWLGWEDYDTWLRLSRLTDRFERIDEVLGYYWLGGGNISTPARLLKTLDAFRKKYVEAPGAPLAALPGWFHYLHGRAHFSSGTFAAVGPQMRLAVAAGLPLHLRLKAGLLRGIAAVRQFTGRGAGAA